MAALGVVVFPLAAAAAGRLCTATAMHLAEGLDWRLQLHAWLALLAYATLAIAALLAIMLWRRNARCAGANSMPGCARCRR